MKEKICNCGDHTENPNGICDTCKVLNDIDAKKDVIEGKDGK